MRNQHSSPEVSVVMPVFNAAAYLKEAADSILKQTFTDFEFIIINDGSDDQTPQILDELASAASKIRLISRERRGLVASLNEGLGAAQGRFIARMDADDWSHPQRLMRQVQFLRENPDCAAVGCRVLLVDPDGEPVRLIATATDHEQIDQRHLQGRGGTMAHPAVMMRRDAVQAIGGYRPQCELAEDLDLFLRMAEHWRLANLPDLLLHYRLHLGSSGTAGCAKQAISAVRAVTDAYRRRQLHPPPGLQERVNHASISQDQPVRQRRTWPWWALKEGNVNTARKHAAAALREDPSHLTPGG